MKTLKLTPFQIGYYKNAESNCIQELHWHDGYHRVASIGNYKCRECWIRWFEWNRCWGYSKVKMFVLKFLLGLMFAQKIFSRFLGKAAEFHKTYPCTTAQDYKTEKGRNTFYSPGKRRESAFSFARFDVKILEHNRSKDRLNFSAPLQHVAKCYYEGDSALNWHSARRLECVPCNVQSSPRIYIPSARRGRQTAVTQRLHQSVRGRHYLTEEKGRRRRRRFLRHRNVERPWYKHKKGA